MELHQVRYFLGVAEKLNFTRAAEECSVSQPSLSRAIRLLEAELGGNLFRRERTLTHLTDLGQAVLPALRQTYEGAMTAKALAQSHLKEGHAPLRVALARSIEIDLLAPVLAEITKAFPRIEIKVFRGPPHEIDQQLRNGEAELAIAGALGNGWERYDAKGLYDELFGLLVCPGHAITLTRRVEAADLAKYQLLCRPHCEVAERVVVALQASGIKEIARHEVPLADDLIGLVRANLGVGILPLGRRLPADLQVCEIDGVEMKRRIHVITVVGRAQSPAALALRKLLRAKDWSGFDVPRLTSDR